MNVLMLLFKDIHYDARVQREAISLAEKGCNVSIACVKEYENTPPFLHNNIKLVRVSVSAKSAKAALTSHSRGNSSKKINNTLTKMVRNPVLKVIKDFAGYYEFYKKVKANINLREIDVVHAHDLNTLWQGSLIKKTTGIPLVYDSHELFNEMAGRNPVDKKIGYLLEERLYGQTDYLITVNDIIRDLFFDRYGKKPSAVVQNIPIFNRELLNKAERQQYFKNLYKLEQEDVILLYQGGLNPHRGIELCINSLVNLPSKFKLVLMGKGLIEDKLKKLSYELKVADRVFFHEQVPAEEIIWYTSQADIGLVMYRNSSLNNYYSTPNKIFEYMQAGIPCVSSKHPGKTYIIDRYQTGLATDETPEAISKSVLKIAAEYPFFKKNCLENRETFTWENEQENLLRLYKDINSGMCS